MSPKTIPTYPCSTCVWTILIDSLRSTKSHSWYNKIIELTYKNLNLILHTFSSFSHSEIIGQVFALTPFQRLILESHWNTIINNPVSTRVTTLKSAQWKRQMFMSIVHQHITNCVMGILKSSFLHWISRTRKPINCCSIFTRCKQLSSSVESETKILAKCRKILN